VKAYQTIPVLVSYQQATMSAVPRDPIFWKRFSTAAHLDEAAKAEKTSGSPLESGRSSIKRS
jgi:hypothetical protein